MAKDRTWGRWKANSPAFDEGGQGRLYEVVDSTEKLAGTYVLKELKNPKRLDRFNNELLAISSLEKHENVIQLIDSGIFRDPTKPCYVMPKADGSLTNQLDNKHMNLQMKFEAFEQVLSGVAHIHASNIIHRDIKPENILMFGDVAQVSDLGLCLIAGMPRHTPSSEVVGPRYYMAPEMEDGKQLEVTAAADIYSLGKLLYYLLSDGDIFAREKHNHREWSLSRTKSDDRFDVFDKLFAKTIVVEPQRRYSSVLEMKEAFKHAVSKFQNHPRTTLHAKVELNAIAHATTVTLQSLTDLEWSELLEHMDVVGVTVTPEFLAIAANSITPSFAKRFAKSLHQISPHLSPETVGNYACRLVQLQPGENWLSPLSEMSPELVELAVEYADLAALNAIANQLSFRAVSKTTMQKIANNYEKLNDEAKVDFLIASMKNPYELRENLLTSISMGELPAPDHGLEASVAGLCNCGTSTAMERVAQLLTGKNDADRLGDILRGVALGSDASFITQLSKYSFEQPIVRVFIETLLSTHESN